MVIGDENGYYFMPESTYSKKQMAIQIQAKPTTQVTSRIVTGELMLTDRRWYRLTDLRPCDQVGKQYGHIVW